MVRFFLQIRAKLQSLTNLQPQGGCKDPDFTYLFKLKCEGCGELSEKEAGVRLNLGKRKGAPDLVRKLGFEVGLWFPFFCDMCIVHQYFGGYNIDHCCIVSCKFCEREGSVRMMPEHSRPLTQTGVYCPLMMFDCKGYEPMDFVFSGGWKVESVTGTTFDNVDLSKGKFAEYDERGERPVKISNLHATFTVFRPGYTCRW